MRRIALALLFALAPTLALAASVLHRTTGITCAAGTTCSVTLVATPAPNSVLVMGAGSSGGLCSNDTWKVNSGGGVASWQIPSPFNRFDGANTNTSSSYGVVGGSPTNSLSLTTVGGATCSGSAVVIEYGGLDTTTATSPFDKSTSGAFTGGNTNSCGALTPARSGDMVFLLAVSVSGYSVSSWSGGALSYTTSAGGGTTPQTFVGDGGPYNSVAAYTGTVNESVAANAAIGCILMKAPLATFQGSGMVGYDPFWARDLVGP